jgi:glucose/arabinose dehydrogenase
MAGLPASILNQEASSAEFGAVNVESLAELDNPWALAFLPDGRLLITEKPGRLRLYADGELSEPVAGVPKVAYRDQGGYST